MCNREPLQELIALKSITRLASVAAAEGKATSFKR
jgi:hypothetical protein